MNSLEAELGRVAAAPCLLVASDFDGVLAPIVPRPELATPDPEALAALRSLSGVARTHAALVSGRALTDLVARAGDVTGLRLIGSHGAEVDRPDPALQSKELRDHVDQLAAELTRIAEGVDGLSVERKPFGAVLHYRLAEPRVAEQAVAEARSGIARQPGIHVREGKMVLEVSVVDADKGRGLDQLRHRVRADTVVYLGDDRTDEDAFAVLGSRDLSIKVGPEATVAMHRVAGPVDAWRILRRLAQLRAAR